VSGKISGVNSSSPPPAAPATSGAGQRAAATPSQAAGATGGATDSVQITDTASHLATVEQALADVPVINQARVGKASESLAAGTYKVSPERIANKLLQFERWLAEEPTDSADSPDSAE
jgi:negative regulator of flagellin synthesis FlgM